MNGKLGQKGTHLWPFFVLLFNHDKRLHVCQTCPAGAGFT